MGLLSDLVSDFTDAISSFFGEFTLDLHTDYQGDYPEDREAASDDFPSYFDNQETNSDTPPSPPATN